MASITVAGLLAGCGGGGGGGGYGGGSAPAIALSARSLSFGAQVPGSASSAQTITVTNAGSATLNVSSVGIAGTNPADFGQTSNCSSVAVNSSCTISVTFAPAASGPYSATLDIDSNVIGSPTTVALSGTGSATGANTVAMVVDEGPLPNSSYQTINILYTTIKICAPGTMNCQTIDHIQVDTGSWGVRVLSSVLTPALAAALSTVTTSAGAGHPLAECTQFADGYSWGPIKTADLSIGGQTASNIRVQVIGDPAFPPNLVPAKCISTAPSNTLEDTVQQFGANGIIGIGYFLEDCGPSCPSDGSAYSDCATTPCTGYAATLAEQIPNPVAKFAGNNNGVAIQMAAVGQAQDTASGTLVFGVGATAGSLPAGVTVFQVDPNSGYFTATYGGMSLNQSFIDTGSNAWYFPNQAPMLATCASPNTGYYCPAGGSAQLTATIHDFFAVANTAPVDFTVYDLSSFTSSTAVAGGLAGTPGSLMNAFDFGSPFYFGKVVYIGFEGQTLGGIQGPAFGY